MRQLSSQDVYRIVEWGQDKHPVDRALVLLQAAAPGRSREDLIRLPLGRRDAILLRLRASTFGERFEFLVRCPECKTAFDFGVSMQQILLTPPDEGLGGTLEEDGVTLRYRLPNSGDLAAVLSLDDPAVARQALLGRCMIALRDGHPLPLSEVPTGLIAAAASAIAEQDPQSDIVFKNTCRECEMTWRSTFDVIDYFWTELDAHALRMQDDVHRIAQAYGWTEDVIIAMPATRRKRYLELISG
jgi:hypothetical protein